MSLHPVGPRLARWLLVMRDRFGSDHLPLTQDWLAEMLAVRRPYLTGLMQSLQRQGHIRYQRGRVNIVSQAGLASAACEDYQALRSLYARLFRSDSR
jgi:CRP-like cAMP-binding protein